MKKIILNLNTNSDITNTLQEEILKSGAKNTHITIPQGDYFLSATINITDNTHITGASGHSTKLTFSDAVNSNMFTNHDKSKGNKNITVENILIDGNGSKQFRPKDEKRLSFCNMFYFSLSKKIALINIKATNCKQTAMHFNECFDVSIDKLEAIGMGWSGISTSGTSDIRATNTYIYDSGKDIMHSGVHFDGGIGSYFSGVVEKCTGNGVMLDSKYSQFNKSVIQVECIDCKRGVSLSGAHENQLSNVLIQNSKMLQSEIGVMVSNSKHVFISSCNIQKSSEYGVLLQGKFGGCNTVISDSTFSDNKQDIAEIHSSNNNYFIRNNVKIKSKFLLNKENIKKKIKNKLDKYKNISLELKQRVTKENNKDDNVTKDYLDKYTDYCSVCGEKSDFIYYDKSVRESYRCDCCSASLRHRGQAKAIVDIYGDKGSIKSIKELSQLDSFKKLAIYEPGIIGPLRKYIDKFPYYQQSYFWDDIPLGESKNGIINQNLEELTFKDDSIDLLITADIFEHIRKPWKAFEEIQRVLKPGGKHIFTVPTQYPLPRKTIFRVDTSLAEDVHILPEHYHIAGDGGKSLVYTEFGADMLEKLNDMGLKTDYVFIDDRNDMRKKNITFVSTK